MKKAKKFLAGLSAAVCLAVSAIPSFTVNAATVKEQVAAMANKYNGWTHSKFKGEDSLNCNDHWCAAFACMCARKAGASFPKCGNINSTTSLAEAYNNVGKYHAKISNGFDYAGKHLPTQKVDSAYLPKPGDLGIIETDGDDSDPDHTVLVLNSYKDSYGNVIVETVEGNMNGSGDGWYYWNSSKVQKVTYTNYRTTWGSYFWGVCEVNYGNQVIDGFVPQVKPTAVSGSRARAVEEAANCVKNGTQYSTSVLFVMDMLSKAGATNYTPSNTINISVLKKNYNNKNAVFSPSSYVPRPGDVALLETNGKPSDGEDAMAIVIGTTTKNGKTVPVMIGRNTSTSTAEILDLSMGDKVSCYCTPYYNVSDRGDINMDGKIDQSDVTILRNYVTHAGNITGAYRLDCANVDRKGAVDLTDLSTLSVRIDDGRIYEGESSSFSHNVGRVASGCCEANTAKDKPGHLAYGPYVTGISTGSKVASFRLKIDNNTAENYNVATIDVYDATTGKALASRTITRMEFVAANTYQEFQLGFTNPNSTHKLEFRVYYCGNSALSFDRVTIAAK